MANILLVGPDRSRSGSIAADLRLAGYNVELVQDGREAVVRAKASAPDVAVVDFGTGGGSGHAMVSRLRQESDHLPVIVLSEGATEADRVLAFKVGAVGVMTAPFSLLELTARIEAHLRQVAAFLGLRRAREIHRFGDNVVDARARTVHRAGREVSLSQKAFDLLLVLLRNRGDVLTRQYLLNEVWGHLAAVRTRTVDQHVCELRRKLEDDPKNPRFIIAVRGVGYRFQQD